MLIKRFNKLNICFKKLIHRNLYSSFNAFTLAEILIVLGIIGIIVAITLPTLLTKIEDYQFKTAYKKVFSIANQALLNGKVPEDGYAPVLVEADGNNVCNNWKIFSGQFKKTTECINNNTDRCWEMSGEMSNGAPYVQSSSFIDSSGIAWAMRGNCSQGALVTLSFFLVDTNGFKKPNKYGKDRWAFWFSYDQNGFPVKISPFSSTDVTTPSPQACPSGGPCYYQSWLLK